MENNKTFYITYFARTHNGRKLEKGKHITRQGKWTEQCRYWTSKLGASLMTYFDIDAQGYRTAKGSWKVRF